MEREGKGEGRKRRGRRGGEKMRGLVIGGMVLGLLFGCNNGGEISAAEKEAEGLRLGETAKSVFSSFVELITNGLGISVTSATTKKSDISDKFKNLADLIEKAIGQVQGAASKAGINIEEDKDGSVGKAKKTLDDLKEHVTSLQNLTNESEVVSGVTKQVQGAGSSEADVKEALKALKGIVNADTNKDKGVVSNKETVSSNESTGGKVLKTSSGGGAAAAADAAKALSIVTSVTGKDMLYAIGSAEDKEVTVLTDINTATDPKHAVKLAIEGSATTVSSATSASKVAVAGGIALRSLLKGGKLDAGSSAGDAMAVNGVGVSAANKLLSAIENIIQRVVKQCLKQTEQILGESNLKVMQEKNKKL